ncbi:hypothetical protein FOZ61_009213 [Perkinsus olseni]|uniref:Peptidase A1 domain-containing protein n=1 Tax=Perkinsus olseni TaxID=32597 RepID=A0A7J6L1L0_PEROL|nr:hypothetical protein FOZ61_009213 [Perkinsus olseni]KAF4666301.1 hypothetical protein FOL46_003154 [Perkinsus olseni]
MIGRLFCIIIGLSVGSSGTKLVRIAIFPQKAVASAVTVQLVGQLKVDGEEINALVDTQSPNTFFVWKHWYESLSPGGVEVGIYHQAGKVDFGTVTADGVEFGLVAECDGPPYASLGLAPQQYDPFDPFVPLVQQLLAQPEPKRLIESSNFPLYLSAGEGSAGELILGGEDKEKYSGPPTYAQIANPVDRTVVVSNLGIGDVSKHRVPAKEPGSFDSGANIMMMAEDFKPQVLQLLTTAGKKPVTITEKSGLYETFCGDTENLPPITFFIQGLEGEDVALEVPPCQLRL